MLHLTWCSKAYQVEFEGIKTLNGHRALHCDKHQFRAKNDGDYLNHYLTKWSEQRRISVRALSLPQN